MKRSTGPSKLPSKLSKSADRRLHAYAVAAGAAGVGLLALSQPAEAKVIHKVVNVTLTGYMTYTLDLNKIGVGDFTIAATTGGFSSGGHEGGVVVFPIGSKNKVWVSSGVGDNAVPLGNDVTIGPGGNFQYDGTIYLVRYFNGKLITGDWQNAKGRFLGFKYVDLAGRPHYGWARLNVGPFGALLIDYEYDNTEYTPVTTCKGSGSGTVVGVGTGIPETEDAAQTSGSPSLGHLAAGAAAIAAWRAESAATK